MYQTYINCGICSFLTSQTNRLQKSKRLLLGFSFVVCACQFLWMTVIENRLTEHFLELSTCPVCYGMKMCNPLLTGDVHLRGLSRVRTPERFRLNGVYYGDYLETAVVVKRLAKNAEFAKFDAGICPKTGLADCGNYPDEFATRMRQLKNAELEIIHLKGLADFTACPSKRLVARIQDKFQEKTEPGPRMLYMDKVTLLATLMINPEPLLLQTFPSSEGWPFPPYLGVCGRFIVAGYNGKSLLDYLYTPFHERVDLAYQVFKIADQLTNNSDGYAIYWLDATMINMAVDSKGKVSIIDAENILVADKLAIAKAKPPGWDDPLGSWYDSCSRYVVQCGARNRVLCNRVESDHNYYVMCQNIFSSFALGAKGMPRGFLHHMPDYAKDEYNLDILLEVCVNRSRSNGRFPEKDELLFTLDQLRKVSSLKRDNYR